MPAFSSLWPAYRALYLRLAMLFVLVPITGLFIVRDPLKAWLILALSAMLMILEVSSVYWVVLAVLAATLSRVAVALGAPHFLNFAHFPLAVGGFVVALLKGESSRSARLVRNGLLAFLAVNVLSWLFNDGEILRPVLNWLVLTEPFLVLYVLLAAPITERTTSLLWKLLLGISFVQVPLGLWQRKFVANGNPDFIQGTFIGSGTGAHVAGAVAMLGVICLVCQGTASKSIRLRVLCFAGAIPLFGLAVVADAKQVVVAFIPGLFFAVLRITRVRPSTVILPVTFLVLVLYVSFHFYKPLQKLGQQHLISGGLQGKTFALVRILSKMSETPAGWVLGLGPGNTVSRVALLTPDAQLDATSSVSKLGLKTAPLTLQLITLSNEYYISKHSSAWSPECSWFGVIGDLGSFGVAVYLGLLVIAWITAGSGVGWLGASAQGSLIAMALLGGVYSWLEEPGFTLLVVLLIGLAVLRGRYTVTRPVISTPDLATQGIPVARSSVTRSY